MNAGQGGHRPARSEKPNPVRITWQGRCKTGERPACAFSHPAISLKPVGTIQRETTLAFGQGNDTPRSAPPAADLRHPVNLVDENELGRDSADVEDESRAIPGLQKLMTAEHG